jgi:hypothetical protein
MRGGRNGGGPDRHAVTGLRRLGAPVTNAVPPGATRRLRDGPNFCIQLANPEKDCNFPRLSAETK